jgi:hypothetical protein
LKKDYPDLPIEKDLSIIIIMTNQHISVSSLVRTGFLLACVLLFGCAASRATAYTYDRRLLAQAEAKFEKRRYPEALKIYQELVSSPDYSQSPSAKIALYRIGYINIYYDNPNANTNAALDAFNSYKVLYSDDKDIGEVNTFVKMLVVLKSFKDQYDETMALMLKFQNKSKIANGSLDTLLWYIQRCTSERDSLSAERFTFMKKIRELEQTIVKMEKTQ